MAQLKYQRMAVGIILEFGRCSFDFYAYISPDIVYAVSFMVTEIGAGKGGCNYDYLVVFQKYAEMSASRTKDGWLLGCRAFLFDN